MHDSISYHARAWFHSPAVLPDPAGASGQREAKRVYGGGVDIVMHYLHGHGDRKGKYACIITLAASNVSSVLGWMSEYIISSYLAGKSNSCLKAEHKVYSPRMINNAEMRMSSGEGLEYATPFL